MSEWKETTIGTIPKDWKLIEAENYCVRVTDGTHDTPKQTTEGPLLITSKHIVGGRIDLESAYHISKEDFGEINKRSAVTKWDIIISMIGTVGEVVLVDKDEIDFAIKNVGLFVCNNELQGKWLKYYLKTPQARHYLKARLSGTTQKYITLGELRDFLIPTPKNSYEQEIIVGVLSSLDDKIELLRKQNETLEAMASALFKHWFVDGAKETWDTGTLNSILSVKGGTTPSTVNSEYWNGIIHWTTPKDLSNNPYIFLFDTERTISKQGLDQISSGLLPVGTILLSSRAPVGYLAITDIPVAVNQGYIAIIDNKGYSKYFLYLWLKLNMRYIKANANGSTFREISKSVFKSLESIKPPKQLRLEFDRIVEPLFQKIRTNSKRIDTLTRLRDLLLLKLMSGEIRVEDINSNGKGNK